MMNIHLSGQREQVILSLLQGGKFASADEVIDEALRLVEECYQESGQAKAPTDRTGQQLENLRRLGRKLDAMPTATVDDGLSNRNHDPLMY
jgi:Arc/MetJ-type ribon-helix-helix transcriptional regulator